MKRRQSTEDIERFARIVYKECKEIHRLVHPQLVMSHPDNIANGPPPPPMPDPGAYENCGRRRQAKHDLEFWRRQREKYLNELGTKMAEGTVVV